MDNERLELLKRMDRATQEWENEGDHIDENGEYNYYYLRFKAKRNAIAEGKSYTTHNVAPALIAYVGSHIPDINYNCKGQLIGGRGNKIEATISALNTYYSNIN